MNSVDTEVSKVTTDETRPRLTAPSTTQPALFDLIDKTIEALVRLDSDALLALEQQTPAISSTPLALSAEMTRILLGKKSLLAHLLADTASNFTRLLRSVKDDSRWVH